MASYGFGASLALRQRRATSAVFELAGALPAGATLTRASPGARVDVSGAFVIEAADVARFDYDVVTHGLRGLLIEPQRSNTFAYSQDWTQTVWTKTGVRSDQPGALIEDATSGNHRIRAASANGHAHVAGEAFCTSAVASERSASAKRYLTVESVSPELFGGNAPYAIFDLATGTMTASGNGASGGVGAVDGGRWRCWMAATPTTSGSGMLNFRLGVAATGTVASYPGDGASGLDVTQVQIEAAAMPSSRIATANAGATRSADVVTLNWAALGVADGAVTVRYVFDDASTQDVAGVISGGTMVVPVTLARSRVRRVGLV